MERHFLPKINFQCVVHYSLEETFISPNETTILASFGLSQDIVSPVLLHLQLKGEDSEKASENKNENENVSDK